LSKLLVGFESNEKLFASLLELRRHNSFPPLFLSTVLPSHHIACHIVCVLLSPLILVRCTHTQILFVSGFYLSTRATIWLTNSNGEHNVDGKTSESISPSRQVANEYARAWQKLANAGE